jgi:hypothetical protein
MQELDISGCTGIDATAVATAVAKNRALSAPIFGDGMGEPVIPGVGMTEADFSNKNVGMGGAVSISAWITHRDKGGLLVLSLKSNDLRADGGKALAKGLKGNTVITQFTPSAQKGPKKTI